MGSNPVMDKIIKKFDNQEGCDVTFRVQGRNLHAHKMILDVQNFQFFNEKKDQAVIEVSDMDYKTFHCIIRFLYTDEIDINNDNVFNLMHASQFLQISAVENQCSSYLSNLVCHESFVHLLNVATDFKNTALQEQLQQFFMGNMRSIIHHVNFKYLTPDGVALLLKDQSSGGCFELADCTALEFFVMLRRWARFECQRQGIRVASGPNIRRAFGENFRNLCVSNMHSEDVARLIVGRDIMDKDEELNLLHYMSLPVDLRDVFNIEIPFNNFSRGNTQANFKFSNLGIETRHCTLCSAKLDCYYGAEMIHCTECLFDVCFKCQFDQRHENHCKFFCVKTVLDEPERCCKACGWPVAPDWFLGGTAESPMQQAPVQHIPPHQLGTSKNYDYGGNYYGGNYYVDGQEEFDGGNYYDVAPTVPTCDARRHSQWGLRKTKSGKPQSSNHRDRYQQYTLDRMNLPCGQDYTIQRFQQMFSSDENDGEKRKAHARTRNLCPNCAFPL